jgi:hypothetical protein
MGIKTGDGGFEIDGQTLTFDVVDDSTPPIEPKPVDKGDISVDKTSKDISKRTKETLASYLSDVTKTNKFKVDKQSSDVSLTQHNGKPTQPAETPNTDKFVKRDQIEFPGEASKQLTNGNRLIDKYDDPSTKFDFSKGKTSPQRIDGNELLPGVPSSVRPYVSTVLANNRFTDSSKIVPADPVSPGDGYDPVLNHPRYGSVSTRRLAQVGIALSLRSSQELGATGNGNNPSSGAQEAKALLPGFNQLGTERVNMTLLEARDVLETLTTSEIPEDNLTSITPGGSWGTLNNVHDPYSGITAVGMIALAAALTAAVVVLFEGLGFLLSLIKGGDRTGAAKNNDGRYALGRYTLTQSPDPNAFPPTSFPPDIGALIGIRPTVHPFSAALQQGVSAFFGIDNSKGLLGQAVSGLASAAENPGFNSVVARSIIRSTLSVIDSFKGAFKSPNLVAGIKNVLTIVDTLRSSKLISAMNVFAMLGDQSLVAELLDEKVSSDLDGEPQKYSRIDKLDNNAPAVQKNRLNGTLKLAWSGNRSPSSYLIPDPVLTLSTVGGRLGAFNVLGQQSPLSRNYHKIISLSEQTKTALRLPYDSADPADVTVKSIEGLLEAEYMPFYFHDLRTNEIISFHAFITQLTDDFTVNWERSDGYGRVDPVKVYKSTDRRISIGFMAVATSDEDFNDMWVKINKLVTMVYPQYTQGRILSDAEGNNQFTQPFSQLIGASPLIRLRMGDIFKSNYSRFALARLFGADSNVMKLDGNELKFESASDVVKALSDDLRSPTGKTYLLNANNMSKPSEAGGISVSLPSIPGMKKGNKPASANVFNVAAGDVHYFVFKVMKELEGSRVVVTPELMKPQTLKEFFGLSAPAASQLLKHLKTEYDNSEKPAKRVVGGEYVASKNDLRISPDRFSKVIQQAVGSRLQAATTNVEKLADFLSPEKNALVKSFKEIQGKGLAGTIDSINFDFFNQTTWETTPGRRAPQFCRVNISFTPIHDISPGLDHMGYNRAPVYSVGQFDHGIDGTKEGK